MLCLFNMGLDLSGAAPCGIIMAFTDGMMEATFGGNQEAGTISV